MKRGIAFIFLLSIIILSSSVFVSASWWDKITGNVIADEYPSLDLSSTNISSRTISQNGATLPVCGEINQTWCKNENPLAEGSGPFEFNWDDGKISCSWLPAKHTYDNEGTFNIKVRVKNTCGFITERSSEVEVYEYPSLDLLAPQIDNKSVEQNGVTFATCGELDLNWCKTTNPNSDGTGPFEFNWDDKKISCSWFPAQHNYSNLGNYTIKLRVKNTCGFISERFSLAEVSENITLPDNMTIEGSYSGFYDFPRRFFDETSLSEEEIIRIMDAQYLALVNMHNGIKPYDFCKIEYQSDVYGMTTPYGLKIGDSAFPSLNQGHPRWEVMSHEQGHNFFGGTSSFYGELAFSNGFLQESLAVLSAFYTYDYILENKISLGIPQNAIDSLNLDFANGRDYQQDMYDEYISGGKIFNVSETKTSQALDYMMITYGEDYGFENYQKVARSFGNEMANYFTFQLDGVSDVEQSTYIIASLSASFQRDFRQDFISLNFPIDEVLYTQVYDELDFLFSNSPQRQSDTEQRNTTNNLSICDGCSLDSKCYNLGYRKSGQFCYENNQFINQKNAEETCDNSFECFSNLCIDGKCVSSGVWQKFLSWLQKLFG